MRAIGNKIIFFLALLFCMTGAVFHAQCENVEGIDSTPSRDPFDVSVIEEVQQQEPASTQKFRAEKWELQGIARTKGKVLAIINDQNYAIGESKHGIMLSQVGENEVDILEGGAVRTLSLLKKNEEEASAEGSVARSFDRFTAYAAPTGRDGYGISGFSNNSSQNAEQA